MDRVDIYDGKDMLRVVDSAFAMLPGDVVVIAGTAYTVVSRSFVVDETDDGTRTKLRCRVFVEPDTTFRP